MKNLILLSLMLLIGTALKAQIYEDATYQDVIYLNNGSTVRGMIFEQVPGVSISIRTKDLNVFSFRYTEIQKVTKESITQRSNTNTNTFQTTNQSFNNSINQTNNANYKSPGLSFLFSFLLPGGGQFYNGETTKGIIMLAGTVVGYGLIVVTYEPALIYAGLIGGLSMQLWSMIDAPISAKRINRQNGLAFKFNIGNNSYLAVNPSINQHTLMKDKFVYGAKVSFNFH